MTRNPHRTAACGGLDSTLGADSPVVTTHGGTPLENLHLKFSRPLRGCEFFPMRRGIGDHVGYRSAGHQSWKMCPANCLTTCRPPSRMGKNSQALSVIHQRIHRTQQLIVRHRLGHVRDRYRLQPVQATKLGVRRAQAIEDHRSYQCLGIEAASRRAQCTLDRLTQPQTRPAVR